MPNKRKLNTKTSSLISYARRRPCRKISAEENAFATNAQPQQQTESYAENPTKQLGKSTV